MLSSFSRFGMCRFSVFQLLSIFLKGHQSETLKISDCKLEWIRIFQVCMFLSFRLSFFLFFCRLFWKLLIFVSVNPPFCNSVYSFVGFVFFVSLAHTQWNGDLFFEPLSFVLQPSLWWVWVRFFVVLARFYFGNRVKFLAALVVSQFLFSSQLVIFPRSTNSFYVFRDVSKLLASDNCLTFNCSSNAIQQHQFRILF